MLENIVGIAVAAVAVAAIAVVATIAAIVDAIVVAMAKEIRKLCRN